MSYEGNKIYGPVRQAQDIRKVLGVVGGIAQLCTSDAINEKAAYKPTNLACRSRLTKWQRLSVNFSTFVGTYYTPFALIKDVVSGDAWKYDKPQAPYYRQCDFDGYNHDAGDWVTVRAETDSIGKDRPLPIDFYGNNDALSASLDALAELVDFGFLANYNTVNFGFILKLGQFNGTEAHCYYIPLTGMLTIWDIVDSGKLIIPANTFNDVGTWYMIPCFTTLSYPQGEPVYLNINNVEVGAWHPVPYSNICSVNVSSTAADNAVDDIDITPESANVTINDIGVVTMSDIKVRVYNSDSSSHRVVLQAKIASGVINGPVELQGRTINVDANSDAVATIQSSVIMFEVADPTLYRLSIDVEYYVDNASSQRRTKYLYYEFYVKKRRSLL